jgi:hypothetical protein
MKPAFAILVSLLALLHTRAQNGPYQPGKIDKAAFEMADCPIDKGAAAVKLVDRCRIYYDRGENLLKMVAERQTRIKILKEKGMAYANVRIPYLSFRGSESIKNIAAYTYNMDSDGNINVTKVDKKSIYTKRTTKNFSEVIIAFPEVRPGSIIEYRYNLERESLGYIEDWYFQDDIPVCYSEFELKAPVIFRFREDPFMYLPVEKQEELTDELMQLENTARRVTLLRKRYVMRNLPGIPDEPFMASKNDYRQRITFQLAQTEEGNGMSKGIRTTWEDVAARLNQDGDFGKELDKGIPAASAAVADALQNPDTLGRMIQVFNVVRNSMDWDGTTSLYALSGVRTAWENKTGSSGDINAVLINLLRQAGVMAEPLLVSTRQNGAINVNYPSERQFNALMAFVPIGNTFYVLDATDRYSAHQLIPHTVCNTLGLRLFGENDHQWIALPPRHQYGQTVVVQAAMDANGLMQGQANITSTQYAKAPRCSTWLDDEAGFVDSYLLQQGQQGLSIEQVTLQNASNDSLGLEQKVGFALALPESGGYRYFSPVLFLGLGNNPFTGDERKSDVDFGYRQTFTLYGSYTIPAPYVFEPPSGSIQLIMPDTSITFSSNLQAEDNLLRVRVQLQFKQSAYLAGNYPALQDFYKKMFAKLNEQIVIRKK